MHDRTHLIFCLLDSSNWFHNIGHPATEDVIVLPSWDMALESCSSLAWENTQLEMRGQLTETLCTLARDRYQLWNSLVDELKQIIDPMIDRKLKPILELRKTDNGRFRQSIWSDMLLIGMEAEYADIRPPEFYARLAHWYLQGHFPCGWQGEFPSGKLVIY